LQRIDRAIRSAAVRRPLLLVALSLLTLLASCRQEPPTYPPECSNGPAAVRGALARAPDGEVAIEGVRLSECLVASSDAGPLASFGGSVIEVAADLARRARAGDERAALELGYLRGALRRGADPTAHDELLFRLDQELSRVDRSAPAYRRGEAAGRERG
jgi:hypothetical protein